MNATYLSEIFGARRRGLFYSLVRGGWPIGVLFTSAVSAWLLPLPVHEFPPHFVIPTLLLCEASSLGAFGTGGGPEKWTDGHG